MVKLTDNMFEHDEIKLQATYVCIL